MNHSTYTDAARAHLKDEGIGLVDVAAQGMTDSNGAVVRRNEAVFVSDL